MTAINNFDSFSICCLSLRKNMNLRKSRFSSRPKRNSSCKDIKSSIQKTRTCKSTKCVSKTSLKTPAKRQKSVLDDTLVINSSLDLNLVTSTPISHEVRKRISRSSNEKVKLKSFNKVSSIMSSPIQKAPIQTKPCKIKLKPALPRGGKYSSKTNVDQILKNNKISSNDQSSFLLNSSVEISYKSAQSRRSSMTLRSNDASKKMLDDTKMILSKKLRPARKVSTTQKHLSNRKKSVGKLKVSKKDLHTGDKISTKELSVCIEKLPPSLSKIFSSASQNIGPVSDKCNEVLISKRNRHEVSLASQGSLIQSNHEIDSSKASRYSLRKSTVTVPQVKSDSKKKMKNKKKFSTSIKNLVSPSTSENFISDLNRVSRRNNKSHNVELSHHSQTSCLSESNSQIENSKSSRYSLRLQNLSKRASCSGSTKTSLKSQKVTKTPKSLLESSPNDAKQSGCSLKLDEVHSSKESTVNKLSQHSSKKTSVKKQKIVKKNYQDKTSKSSKKVSNSSKKQSSSKKSTDKFQRGYLSLSGDIPIDDLALTFKSPEKRKVKSDGGFKVPGKNTLKRKRCAINAIIKADEDYEDDLYESKRFDQFKELLMDTSDSERSFSISTPKFPVTPLIRHKTPKFRDCFSPGEYELSRKAAMEYIYRTKKRKSGQKLPETPVIAEKKKLEYSQVIEDAQKLQKTIESLAEEESDNDSYFSFN